MTTRTTILGGTDWSDGQVLTATDLNDTFNSTRLVKGFNGSLINNVSVSYSIARSFLTGVMNGSSALQLHFANTPSGTGIYNNRFRITNN